jgi:hypothetical protein
VDEVRGVFGDLHARIVALVPRSKKQPAADAEENIADGTTAKSAKFATFRLGAGRRSKTPRLLREERNSGVLALHGCNAAYRVVCYLGGVLQPWTKRFGRGVSDAAASTSDRLHSLARHGASGPGWRILNEPSAR